jgi:predicted AlkP superfamily pyrophosphatase or phosphodiesterase
MTKKKKKIIIIIAAASAVLLGLTILFTSLSTDRADQARFERRIRASDIFDNHFDAPLHQPDTHRIMVDHMLNNTSGKTPKLLFVGYDGARADLLLDMCDDSAVKQIAAAGTLLLGRTGGANIGDQPTDTAPGWAVMWTGMWGDKNGIRTNNCKLNEGVDTIFYTLHKNAKNVSFSYSWRPYGTVQYVDEIKRFGDTEIFKHFSNDDGTVDSMLNAINGNADAIFGVLEYTDSAGHTWGFRPNNKRYRQAFLNAEDAANRMINAVKARPTYDQEDWLIILASDHGGYGRSHGKDVPTASVVWYAFNKPVADLLK